MSWTRSAPPLVAVPLRGQDMLEGVKDTVFVAPGLNWLVATELDDKLSSVTVKRVPSSVAQFKRNNNVAQLAACQHRMELGP